MTAPVRAPRAVAAPGEQSFSSLLAHHRGRLGWSQNRLAREAGIDPAYINRMERDTGNPVKPSIPRRWVVEQLAEALYLKGEERDELLIAAGYWPGWDVASTLRLRRAALALKEELDGSSRDTDRLGW